MTGNHEPLRWRGWFRFHKRTLLVVLCLIVLPWTLIAIPASSPTNQEQFDFGWPFVHLACMDTEIDDGIPNIFRAPNSQKEQELRIEQFLDWPEQTPQLNLRLDRGKSSAEPYAGLSRMSQQEGYWSETSRWPIGKSGRHYKVQRLGMTCNLLLLAIVAWLFAHLVEYRIRRKGRLIAFSLRSMIVTMTCVAVLFVWGSSEVSRDNQIARFAELEELSREQSEEGSVELRVNDQTRFPLVVSQLLNHGKLPWDQTATLPTFMHRKGSVSLEILYNSGLGDEQKRQIVEALKDAPCPVTLTVGFPYKSNDDFLRQLNGVAKIEDLHLGFGQRVEGQTASGVNLPDRFEFLKSLTLTFQYGSKKNQSRQLKPFMEYKDVNSFFIYGLNKSGAQFILKNKDAWPRVMHLDFADDVPQDLQDQLDEHFPGD